MNQSVLCYFLRGCLWFSRIQPEQEIKIFLGYGGSLFLGFLLVSSGPHLIVMAEELKYIHPVTILEIVIGFFLVPVPDSLRVYQGRIKRGKSPFRSDKSHLRHLFLLAGLNHKKTSVIIIQFTSILIIITAIMAMYFPLTLVMILAALSFFVLTNFLKINKDLHEWKNRIRKSSAA